MIDIRLRPKHPQTARLGPEHSIATTPPTSARRSFQEARLGPRPSYVSIADGPTTGSSATQTSASFTVSSTISSRPPILSPFTHLRLDQHHLFVVYIGTPLIAIMSWTNRQRACFAAHIIFASLVTLFIAARFAAKHMKRLGATSDDYLLLLALLFMYTMLANSIACDASPLSSMLATLR
ncbi:hypothetical protein K505DRAFT_87854 [Melanomma pulvis-pyrius CBS 109.77]|uniref:Uncharacterized protein n=1 Tax=Melanomma pulvis-pyrius CBS 109.77 TaxID=1314802 RepID=A0A6A6XQV1_9PLEO|nr:hypothetical protein K505DRAFT_87854 [Melanomma pulvis-pyrius CBS 109.77]